MPSVVIPDMTVAARAGQGLPQPINLLTTANEAAQLGGQNLSNVDLANRLTMFASRQAAARDFQGAIDPATGQLDQAALNRGLAADPRAALAAPEMSQQGLANMGAQLQNQGFSLDQAIKRISYASNATGSLLADPSKITRKSVINTIVNEVADGVYSAKDAAQLAQTVPDDPAQAVAWVKSHYAGAQAAIQGVMPHLQIGNNGQYQFAYNTNPAGGAVGIVPGSAVPNALTPAQAAQPVTLPTPSGAPVVTTLGGVASGHPAPIAQGPTTQQLAANERVGAAQGTQAASTIADATNLAQQRAALEGIRVELPAAAGGPLSEKLRDIGATLGEMGIANLDQANAYDLLQKGQAQLVISRVSDGLGVPTDGKMAAVIAQTPGAHMTGPAAAAATGQIEGILDYQQARAQAAQAAGVLNNPAQSAQFNLEWQKRFPNAAVFQFAHLPPAYQQKYWKQMSPSEQRSFYAQMQDAHSAGFTQFDSGK